jgi:toxin ParE1/3/4
MAYIAERQPVTARKVLAEIGKTGDRLGVRAIGRPGLVTGTYENSVTGRPYIIAYTLALLPDGGACVGVLHVIHTARDWQRGHWPS